MKKQADQGMTLLEVVIAMTILFIVVGFILKSDAVAHRYSYKGQVRQQMIFYAAGLLEANIENYDPTVALPPDNLALFNNFHAALTTTPTPGNSYLERVEVKVYLKNSPTDPEPVSLYTYRVKP